MNRIKDFVSLSLLITLSLMTGGREIAYAESCPLVLNAVDYAYYYSENTFSPNDFFIAGQNYSLEYRSFIGFHIPTLGRQVVAAELWLSGQIVIFGDGPETIEFNEVTNSLQAVQQGGTSPLDIFNDLGDGALFGAYTFVPNLDSQSVRIPLNSAFLAKLQTAQDSDLVLGAKLSSLNTTSDNETVSIQGAVPTVIALALTFQTNDTQLQILTQPSGGLFIDGESWEARAFVCGNEPVSYQWRRYGTNIPGATSMEFSISPLHMSDTGGYDLIAQNSSGSVTTFVAQVSVSPLRFTQQPPSGIGVYEGNSFTLTANVESYYPVTYQWHFKDVAIPGETNASLTIANTTTNDMGSYLVVASNQAGALATTTTYVSITSYPPFISGGALGNQTAGEGATVLFYAPSFAAPPPHYFWFHNGVPLEVADGPELLLVNVSTNDSGDYNVTVSNRLGIAFQGASLDVSVAGPLDHWTLRTPTPQPQDLIDVSYLNNQYFAVGANGTLINSLDGQNWQIQQSRTRQELRSITYGAGKYVAVGDGIIVVSTNGQNWTSKYSAPYGLTDIAYGNGVFVASFKYGADNFLISSNGLDWQSLNIGIPYSVGAVTFGNGQFVAGISGNPTAILRSTNGLDWTSSSLGIYNTVECIRYAGGRFVATISDGSVFTSNDGSQWIKRNTGNTRRLLGIDYGNGAYIGVGVRGTILRTSDLIHWTAVNSGTPDRLEGVVFGQGQFLALGESGTTLMSVDGVAWTKVGQGTHFDLDGITSGENGIVMAVGKNGTVLTTSNGTDIVSINSGTTNELHSVTYVQLRDPVITGGGPSFRTINRYVAVGESGTIVTSDDGLNWMARSSPTNVALKGVTYGKGLYVAVGDLGTILTSGDSLNWQRQNSGLSSFASLNDVAFGNDIFVVAKDDGDGTCILYSSNGLNWVNARSRTVNMRSIVFAQGRFVIAGNDGVAFTSTNGSSWSPLFTGNYKDGDNLRNVTYANGIWAIVGNEGIIITSPDLLNWRRRYCPTFVNLHGVRYLPNGTFIAVGNGGTMLQSDRFAHLLEGSKSSNGFMVTLRPGLGETIRLQKSFNLINWTNLVTFTNPPNPVLYRDSPASDQVGVYRAVSP